jgi:2-keto-4-pentenoate hydratase/2-oxohepta-3-ene-1,7-dioic acid hydratase in catechol pathway
MRLCRFRNQGTEQAGLYDEQVIVPLTAAAAAAKAVGANLPPLPDSASLLDYLPHGAGHGAAKQLAAWVDANAPRLPAEARLAATAVELLVPIPRPNKLLLLAGNYAEHIQEGGGQATERQETFPYVFMKPPSTTLTDPGQPIRIPRLSPAHIDWELELAVIIGRRARHVKEADALSYVAGYTVINDISDRKFRPNPGRKKREKDAFFDWLHGKWHDSFCPCGPCVLSADALSDPQTLPMRLAVNGQTQQDASTGLMIFPAAAVIEFISSFVTLEPGDIISTGTPAGVGNAKGLYLKPGDTLTAHIGGIGTLTTPVAAEE